MMNLASSSALSSFMSVAFPAPWSGNGHSNGSSLMPNSSGDSTSSVEPRDDTEEEAVVLQSSSSVVVSQSVVISALVVVVVVACLGFGTAFESFGGLQIKVRILTGFP